MHQLFSAVNYLHANKIAHRDIKLENVLFADAEGFNVRLIDLGSASEIRMTLEGKPKKFRDPSGSAYYMAPENILGRYDEMVDVWSLGVVLYILLSNELPFDGPHEQSIFNKIRNHPPNLGTKLLKYRTIEAMDLLKKTLYR